MTPRLLRWCVLLGLLGPQRGFVLQEPAAPGGFKTWMQSGRCSALLGTVSLAGHHCIVSALQGPLHQAVVDAIRPFLPQLRTTPNGKRILSKINVKI